MTPPPSFPTGDLGIQGRTLRLWVGMATANSELGHKDPEFDRIEGLKTVRLPDR